MGRRGDRGGGGILRLTDSSLSSTQRFEIHRSQVQAWKESGKWVPYYTSLVGLELSTVALGVIYFDRFLDLGVTELSLV